MSTTGLAIPIFYALNLDEYDKWKYNVRAFALAKKLSAALTEKPADMTEADYQDKVQSLTGWISSALRNSAYEIAYNKNTAKEIMDAFEKHFHPDNVQEHYRIQEQMENLCLENPHTKPTQYVYKMYRLNERLGELEANYKMDRLILWKKILAQLSRQHPKYENLKKLFNFNKTLLPAMDLEQFHDDILRHWTAEIEPEKEGNVYAQGRMQEQPNLAFMVDTPAVNATSGPMMTRNSNFNVGSEVAPERSFDPSNGPRNDARQRGPWNNRSGPRQDLTMYYAGGQQWREDQNWQGRDPQQPREDNRGYWGGRGGGNNYRGGGGWQGRGREGLDNRPQQPWQNQGPPRMNQC